MRTVVRVVLSFLIGFVVAYVVVVAGQLAYMSASDVVDRDGGMTMGIIFMIGPVIGILGGIAAAIIVPIRLARRDLASAAPTAPKSPRLPPKVRAAIAAAIFFIAAYALSWLLVRLMFGTTFSTYRAALAVALSPYGFGLLAAALAAFRVLRKARRESGPAV